MVGNSSGANKECQDRYSTDFIEAHRRRSLIAHEFVSQQTRIPIRWSLAFRRNLHRLKPRGRIPSLLRRDHPCGRIFGDLPSTSSRRLPSREAGRLFVLFEVRLYAPGFAARRQFHRVGPCTLNQPMMAQCRGGLMSADARDKLILLNRIRQNCWDGRCNFSFGL
jgi:hypothetical protein